MKVSQGEASLYDRAHQTQQHESNAITPLMMYTQSYSVMFAGRILGDSGAEYNDRGSIALRAGWQYRGASRGNPVAGLPGSDARPRNHRLRLRVGRGTDHWSRSLRPGAAGADRAHRFGADHGPALHSAA